MTKGEIKMKKIVCVCLVVLALISLAACSTFQRDVLSSEDIVVEGIYVNDSYRDSDESSRRALYLFFDINATKENYGVDSKYMEITFDDANTYSSECLPGTLCEYAPNYYYSTYIEDVYVGENQKLVATFLVPEGELVAGKKITIKDDELPGIENIIIHTDNIVHMDSDENICNAVDPDGCAKILAGYEEAPAELASEVKDKINNKYWEAYVNPISYRIEFRDDEFVLKTMLGENGGTYSIRKEYIFCTYASNGTTIKIPYELTSQGVKLSLADAFDR